LPILRVIDFENLEKRLKKISNKTDTFLKGLIQEHQNKKQHTNTMIDHLLCLQESQPEYYTDQIIKGLALVIIIFFATYICIYIITFLLINTNI
jgi:isoflavone 2'-hydroxylase